ncbi:YraN family protein [Candidatus Spongiihabitans sp.]|uniref:YraN family protein n=1 Tax=Candidatus Spongiihabitans sp. TaxID=3101308 RepID=UPI003C6F6393
MKAAHLRRGEQVESAALAYLQSNGLTFVEKNYRAMYGEIDLIMMDQHDLVFVEVRYRKNEVFGGATQSVDANKQQKLRRTAETFLQKNHSIEFDGCRFDVVAVSGQSANYKIQWIRDAF